MMLAHLQKGEAWTHSVTLERTTIKARATNKRLWTIVK